MRPRGWAARGAPAGRAADRVSDNESPISVKATTHARTPGCPRRRRAACSAYPLESFGWSTSDTTRYMRDAATLNATNIGRECGVKRGTVENYIQILEDLLLAYTLPVFTRRAQRALSSHPKFYLFDAGIFQALRPRGPLDRPEEIHGAGLEGLVAQHLRAWNGYSREKYELAFWRTRSQLEVDFVVYGPKG